MKVKCLLLTDRIVTISLRLESLNSFNWEFSFAAVKLEIDKPHNVATI